jgi:hypothetical protein
MCPSKSSDHCLLRGFPSHFPLDFFLPELQIRRHTSFSIEQSIFTSRIRASRVSTSPFPISSRVLSPRVNRSLPQVLLRSMVIIHFRTPALHAGCPRALKCQSTWQSSVQIFGALASHDTWHPSGDDMWQSVQAPLGISSACFQVTHVTSLFHDMSSL